MGMSTCKAGVPPAPPEALDDFCYVQRLRLADADRRPGLRFGEAFSLEYMGAAEYEFGAFARFLRTANDCRDHLVEAKAVIAYGDDQVICTVTCFYDPQTQSWAHIEKQLTLLAQGKLHTKCGAHFPAADTRSLAPVKGRRKAAEHPPRPTTCGWVEIGQNVFWTTSEITLAQYRDLLHASVEHMDAQKAQQ
ncbi:hypothetical protein DV532_25920 (plasmid) [Pseudomonas sp. Leaf58]|uniref:hypothetical protein n=1 Tax=Pseudomonas sp. Leaf58 TaxID=1736226 RepID=UPI0007006B63|nr:hypothetical protein [Pseudomonas sp. Leaf58]AYG47731.1 hypothetical protein DV532_25920 [Pseudomonas sp. Leaf58]KQN62705.1 hypothetical protein ASF02_11205 [Pseudomonas sp. Leaf58]